VKVPISSQVKYNNGHYKIAVLGFFIIPYHDMGADNVEKCNELLNQKLLKVI
jgi:hypothetical protein